MTQEVKLGDYATDDGLYFVFDHRVYTTDSRKRSVDDVRVVRWDDGLPSWMPVETLVVPLAMPSRPKRPSGSWLTCRDTTMVELREGLRHYMRQMEAYVDALEKSKT